jgi:hypothetical protein
MREEKLRRRYEPPLARDLSAFSVSGDRGPMGECIHGDYPYFQCSKGTAYISDCNPGTGVDTSHCSSGGVHTDPACNYGQYATTRCWSGAHQNFT